MGFNRYFHTKKVEYDGIIFDSSTEVDRYRVLKEAEKRGLISDLRLQVVFTLIPRQTEAVEVKLKTKTKIVEKFREHPVTYAADFVYNKDGKEVVEDSKSTNFFPEDYVLKRKMMRYFGHPIREVFDPTIDYQNIAAELNIEPPRPKKKKPKKEQKPKSGPVTPGLFE